MHENLKLHSFEGLNLLFLARKSSIDGGTGVAAMVGASNAGSLSFSET